MVGGLFGVGNWGFEGKVLDRGFFGTSHLTTSTADPKHTISMGGGCVTFPGGQGTEHRRNPDRRELLLYSGPGTPVSSETIVRI